MDAGTSSLRRPKPCAGSWSRSPPQAPAPPWRRLGRIDLDRVDLAADQPSDELLALDEALDRLAAEEPAVAEVVKLRYFAGLPIEGAADALGISVRTANRHWAYARAGSISS